MKPSTVVSPVWTQYSFLFYYTVSNINYISYAIQTMHQWMYMTAKAAEEKAADKQMSNI